MYIPNKGGIYRSTHKKITLPRKQNKNKDDTIIETQFTQYLR